MLLVMALPLKFTTVLSTLKSNFDIPFSIRTEKEAHIFLCDGEDPHESNCYWIMLQAFGGSETAIRKCSKHLYLKLIKNTRKESARRNKLIYRFVFTFCMFYINL
jgi:hypothetical protein